MTRRNFGLTLGAAAAVPALSQDKPTSIGNRRELFVDRALIGETKGVELRLAIPVDAGPALQLDRPWEGRFSGYTTILKDGDLLRMYYRGTPVAKDGGDNEVTCYAESRDGVQWSRPDLNLYGNTNIILAKQPPFSHNFTPFLDTRPGVPNDQRLKALSGYWKTGLVGWVSWDGVHWTRFQEAPVLPPPPAFSLDSQNIAMWVPEENQYVLYYRTWKKIGKTNFRWTSRAVSKDFHNFAPAGEMNFGDAPPEHLYTNQTSSYFRAPHIYVGICARFEPGRQVLTEEQAKAINVDPKYFKDCSDAVMISSRGGNRFDRLFMEAFLRPGVGMQNWVSRSNYPALNLFQSGPATMSFLVNRNYGQPTAYLRRYDLRLDGFASAHAGYAGGELVTKPIVFDGSKLELNYSTSAAGSVKVEVLAESGTAAGRELVGDEIDRVYDLDVAALRGKPVRIRFHLKDADLYSYRFRD